MRKRVLVFRELPAEQLARIADEHDVVVADPRAGDAARRAFLDHLPTAHGLIGSSLRIGRDLIDTASALEVVSSVSAGVDNYDVERLRARGIVLCHTPDALTETTADMLFLMILAASRRLVELANHVRDGRWTGPVHESLFGWDVHGKTLGIIGFGRIGQALARRAALGFGMPVLFHNRSPVDPGDLRSQARAADLDTLLAVSDIVALTLPLTPATRGLMNAERFSAMKPGAIFVNGARGAVVDEDALVRALDRGHLRAAALDVFAIEPLPPTSPLCGHPRVTALPHIGSATHETRRAMAVMATTNLLQALRGQAPLAQVR